MQSESLRQEIVGRLGTFPPFFQPALATPEVLQAIWEEIRTTYLDNPLPPRLKEKIALRISLYGTHPFALFWHCCELNRAGVTNREIVTLLEAPVEIDEALKLLHSRQEPVADFPPVLEDAIAIASEAVFLRLPEIDMVQRQLRQILGADLYNHWVTLVACLEMSHRWADAHPEIGLEMDSVTLGRSMEMLKSEPRLLDFLERWRERLGRNRYLEERKGQEEAHAPQERERRLRFRYFARVAALVAGAIGLGLIAERAFAVGGGVFPMLLRELKASVGVASILSACGLWGWTRFPPTRRRRMVARVLGGAVCILAVLVFAPGPASPLTAVVFFLLGVALILMEESFHGDGRLSRWFAAVAGVLGYFSLLANAFGINQPLAGSERMILMSTPSSSASLVLALGILAARPSARLLAMAGGGSHAGRLVRRVLFLFVLFPMVLGWVGAWGEWAGWYSEGIGIPIIVIGNLLILGGAALSLGRSALRSEHRQEQAETLLHHREQDFRGTFDQASVGMAHMGLDGRCIRVNDRLCEILGYSREELLGKSLRELVHPEDREEQLALSRRLMTGEIPEYNVEIRYLRKDGKMIWGNAAVTMLRGAKGERRYVVVIVEEITERKLAEEEAARQKANAEAASQAKDRLLSVISHELRTPLTPVLAALSDLKADSAEEREQLALIRRNIEHEICLVDDLLDLTRLTHGKLRLSVKPLDLHALIDDVAASLRSTLEAKGIRLRLSLLAARHGVEGDSSRLRQVLFNLLDNARKFTPAGGLITVATALRDDRILVTVSDTGAGISPGNLARIFEAFEQGENSTQRNYGGLGLGLTITKGLVEAHGGALGVESPGPGRGSSFGFEIPLSDAPLPVSAHSPPSAPAMRVLLVEDLADSRQALQRLLERRGHEVCAVSGVEEAIAAARETPFDVLISDLGLPDGNGLELPAVLTAACGRAIPALALSGFASEQDALLSARAGYLRHLAKPVDLRELEEALSQIAPAP